MRLYRALLCLLLFCGGVEAAGLKTSVHVTRPAKNKEPVIKISYRHSTSAVHFDSVCDNYPFGSIGYRNCRTAARDLFREKCATATAAFYATRSYSEARSIEREKWCDAGVRFLP